MLIQYCMISCIFNLLSCAISLTHVIIAGVPVKTKNRLQGMSCPSALSLISLLLGFCLRACKSLASQYGCSMWLCSGQNDWCSEALVSGHVNLLPVSMVALSVYIQGKMTECSEAFASGQINLLPVYIQGKWPNAPRLLLQGMSISISLPLAMPMPRLYT